MGDGGRDDPWYTKGRAIHMLLNDENGTKKANRLMDAWMFPGSDSIEEDDDGNGDDLDFRDGSLGR